MDTDEPRDRDDQSEQMDHSDNGDLPTTPLPWEQDAHDEPDGLPTTPLVWPAAQQHAAPVPTPASTSAPTTWAPTTPAPGMAVTDGMKAGESQTRPSFVRRHTLGLGVAAAVLAVVVVAGGTAWGVSAAVAAANTAVPAASNQALRGTAKHAATGAGARTHAKGTVGTLTAISGDTWTVRSAAGATITVTVDSSTAYGTPKKPATASSFAVGDRIAVLGARSGDSVTATRIAHLAAKHSTTSTTSTPVPTPAPTV